MIISNHDNDRRTCIKGQCKDIESITENLEDIKETQNDTNLEVQKL